ncbi:AraC family transcriptional regulator [Rugosimonospora acidiphila]|uniref:AraC family transcriptional regulator n=1 Tax=Rugosimonospora acidiphila TaxID=556531 RepID=UPI0031EB0A51
MVLRSSDLDETKGCVARELATSRLEFASNDRHLDARIHAVRLPWVTPMYIAYGGDITTVSDDDRPFFFVQVPVSGRVDIRTDRQEFASTATHPSVGSPTGLFTMRWRSDSAAMVFRIDRIALESELVDLTDIPVGEPLRFEIRMDVASRRIASWVNVAMFFASELNEPEGIVHNPLIAAEMERIIMRGLLLSQPHTYTANLAEGLPQEAPYHVSAAIAIMEHVPERPLTVGSLARRVGVSTRLLQESFREYLGVSPMQYLRHLRLRRVREDLVAAQQRDGVTVAALAHRWGFTHLGRFAQDYRSRYGESPSQTLRAQPGEPEPAPEPDDHDRRGS